MKILFSSNCIVYRHLSIDVPFISELVYKYDRKEALRTCLLEKSRGSDSCTLPVCLWQFKILLLQLQNQQNGTCSPFWPTTRHPRFKELMNVTELNSEQQMFSAKSVTGE